MIASAPRAARAPKDVDRKEVRAQRAPKDQRAEMMTMTTVLQEVRKAPKAVARAPRVEVKDQREVKER